MPTGGFVIKDFSGGVRLDLPPRKLAENELAASPNVWPVEQDELGLHGTVFSNKATSNHEIIPEAMLLIPFNDENGAPHVVFFGERRTDAFGAVAPLLVDYRASFGIANDIVDANTLAANFDSRNRPGYVVWNGKLYLFSGVNRPGYVVRVNPNGNLASSELGLTWSASDKPRARCAWLYRGQFMLAGFDAPEESTIRNCAIHDPETLVSSTLSFYLGRGDGDRIIGGIEIPVKGGAQYIEPYSLVWKRNSTWMIQGPPPVPGDTKVAVNVMNVLPKEGLIAPETVAQTPFGTIWCSGQNVWMALYGEKPIPIGDAIRPLLEKAPKGHRSGWHAVYYNGVYRLTLPSSRLRLGAVYPITDTEQWWCDLRQYEEKKTFSWWGPLDIPFAASAVQPGSDGRLLAAFGSKSEIFDLVGGAFIGEISATTTGKIPVMEPFAYVGLAAPDFELRTREYDGGDPDLPKLFQSVELHAKLGHQPVNEPYRFQVDVYGDGGSRNMKDWPSSLTPAQFSPEVGLGSFILGTSSPGTGFQAASFYPPGGARYHPNTFQVVVRSPGDDNGIPSLRLRTITPRFRPIGRRP